MESLKIKADELASLAVTVRSGLKSTVSLDDDDIYEAEFQIDSCLKALKNLKQIVKTTDIDCVDAAIVLAPDSLEKPDVNVEQLSRELSFGEPDMIRASGEPDDVKADEYIACSPEQIAADTSPEPVASKSMDEEAIDDDVLAAFLDDDDDDLEALDASNVEDQEEHVLDGVDPPTVQHRQVLKLHFGHVAFRPFQWSIISAVLRQKRDQCVVMATGYGKSLCYQFPSVFTGRTSVVVSPLISLMQDQVLSLKMVNIPATYLGSAQENSASVRKKIMEGRYRIVYITPEFATASGGPLLKGLNNKVGIDLIAIDEAHCVSQWGHDFRDSYQKLGFLREMLPNVPILAVTATATPAVRQDISRSLSLVNAKHTCTSFDRANLRFSVQLKSEVYSDLKSQMTKNRKGEFKFDGPTIIYCPTRKSVDEVVGTVRGLGISCSRYHAGLGLAERKASHEQFVSDVVECIVATVAFGMGIDKPDVRLIIHYGAPKDLESYYQEIGRAGRDGDHSACVAFYSPGDFITNKAILSNQDIKNEQFLGYRMKMLQKMQGYLSSTECRRKLILTHFDKNAKSDLTGTNDCCDNCQKRNEQMEKQDNNNSTSATGMTFGVEFDFGEDAKLLFQSMELFREKYGLGASVCLLSGSSDKRAQQHSNSRLFGSGKHHTQKWWSTFGRMLINYGYIAEERVKDGFGCTVHLTTEGRQWFKKAKITKPVLELKPNQELLSLQKLPKPMAISFEKKILPTVPCNTWLSSKQISQFSAPAQVVDSAEEKTLQSKLYTELMKLRNVLAEEQSCAPYMVASNKNLLDLAKFRPLDMVQLAKIEDLPEVKQEKFGPKFIECLENFCDENNANSNRFPKDVAVPQAVPDSTQFDQSMFMLLPETARVTYSLIEIQKLTLDQACERRGLKASTLTSHMCNAIKLGLPVDIEQFGVTEKVRKLIVDTIRAPPINSDISKRTPIKEVLPEHITWEQLNIVIAILERQYGLDQGGESKPTSAPPSQSRTTAPPTQSRITPAASASDDSMGKRKLPDWMGGRKGTPALKKQKSSLFKR